MSTRGFVKLHRKITKSSIWSDPFKLKLWLLCLTKASHKKQTILHGNQKIHIDVGEFITGRDALEKEFNEGATPKNLISSSTLFRWLKLFENEKMLNIKKTNKYTIVTVLNWSKYQHFEQDVEQQMNNKCTTNEQQMNTYKNNKEYIKNNKEVFNIRLDINSITNTKTIDLIEREFNRKLQKSEISQINSMCSYYGTKLVNYALREAVIHGVTELPYMVQILKRWKAEGFTPEMYEAGKY